MDLQYKKAMEEYKLKLSDLSEDGQIAIQSINEVTRALNMLEKRGKKPTEKTLKRLKALDKWAYFEILDIVNDTNKNTEEMPENPEKLVQEINEQAVDGNPEENSQTSQEINTVGFQIENELENLIKSGKNNFNFDELKKSAKKTYDVLFDGYEEGYENGIETSKYQLIETDKHIFTLNKK